VNESGGIAWEVRDGVGRIVLRTRTLSRAASAGLAGAIDGVLARAPGAIVLRAEGPLFCAGGDIVEFAAAGGALPAYVDEVLGILHPALLRLTGGPSPIVSAVGGAVAGAGIGLALCADVVLAAPSMTLRSGYAGVGLSPDLGSSWFLSRRIGPVRAHQVLVLGDPLDARRCLEWGAIDEIHPDAALAPASEALARRLARGARGTSAAVRELCGGLPGRGLREHLALEHAHLRRTAGSPEAHTRIAAFLEDRIRRSAGR
jgi:2-(1,2-epoxy-1,2-dihydrophenyl)acetyl-CoA isomerase